MTRAAILARVSDEKQLGDDRHSLSNQVRMLQELAARRGWEVVRTYELPGESAFVDELRARPLFAAAVEAAERGEFDVLLVAEFSRFSRSLRVAFDVIYRLQRAGVQLIDERGTNYTEDEDRAVFDAWAARRSSRDHAHRVRNGILGQFRRGLPVGDIPFGYRRPLVVDSRGYSRPDTNVPPVVVPEEAEAIRWAYAQFERAGSYLAIAEEFNRRGLHPRSKSRAHRPPNEWFGFTSVQRILESRFYCGYVSHKGEELAGLHEAIVDEGQWQRVQDRKRRRERSSPSKTLLAGLVYCSMCGRRMTTSGRGSYFREQRRGLRDECAATRAGGWRQAELEGAVSGVVRSLALDGDWLARVASLGAPVMAVDTARRDALLEERRRLGVQHDAGVLTDEALVMRASVLNRQLAALSRQPDEVKVGALRLRDFGRVWDVMDAEERREVVHEVLEAVAVDLGGRRWWVSPREGYGPLLALRAGRDVGDVRPGGLEPHKPTLWWPRLYSPAELGCSL